MTSGFAVNLACLLGCAALALAPAPAQSGERLIPFQGELSDAGAQPLDGSFALLFAIYDAPSGGTPIWSELHPQVSVNSGRINVILGNQNPIDDLAFGSQVLHLGITVAPQAQDIGSSQELVPRHQLIPSFHAASATEADRVQDGGITTEQVADGAISAAKLASGAVTSDKLAPNAIQPGNLSPAAVSFLIPTGAIILWDQSNSCPPGFAEATEFRTLTIRGADRAASSPDLPDSAGVSCTGAGCPGGGPAQRFDDNLEVEELASHTHQQVGRHDSDGGGTQQIQLGQFVNAPPAVPSLSPNTNATGGNQNHYHAMRTVLFCRRQ